MDTGKQSLRGLRFLTKGISHLKGPKKHLPAAQGLASLMPLPSVPALHTYYALLRQTCSGRCWTDLGKSTCQLNPHGFCKGTHKHSLYMWITHTVQIMVTGRPICKWCFSCDILQVRIGDLGIPCGFKFGKKSQYHSTLCWPSVLPWISSHLAHFYFT